jgi:hypothetical protein
LCGAQHRLRGASSEPGRALKVLFSTPRAWYSFVTSRLRVGAVLAGYRCPSGHRGHTSGQRLHRVSRFVVRGVVSLKEVPISPSILEPPNIITRAPTSRRWGSWVIWSLPASEGQLATATTMRLNVGVWTKRHDASVTKQLLGVGQGPGDQETSRHTSGNMSLEVFLAGKALPAVRAKHHHRCRMVYRRWARERVL